MDTISVLLTGGEQGTFTAPVDESHILSSFAN